MIDFANPWMLLGLLLAAVPIAVHLFGRRNAPVVRFSALAFVLASNPRKARALRISEWLLVGLRSAAVAFIAIALARPMLPVLGPPELVESGDGPVALVVVLDDSMSTMATSQGEPLFERARSRALALIERLPPGSKVAAVAAGHPARILVRTPTEDRGAVLDAVRRLEHRPRRDDGARALGLADALLSGSGVDDRRVVVLTDLQASGWQGVSGPWSGRNGGQPAVHVRVDRLDPDSRENTAITEALASPATDRGPNQVRVEVGLVHHGQKPFRDYLTLKAGDREIKSLVSLQPGETLRRSYVVPAGAAIAEVRLPDDGLKADNTRLLRLDAGTGVRVALVNGAPRPVPREDEAFFAARALELSATHPGELAVDVLQLPGLTPQALNDYDVIVLANVGELPETLVQGLASAVESGKGLLVTVGDNLPADLPTFLSDLLPAPLQDQRLGSRERPPAPESGEPGADPRPRSAVSVRVVEAESGSVTALTVAHRLRMQLAASVGDSLDATSVWRYALATPSASASAQAVMRYSDGAPALLVAAHGRGLVGLWTTSLDRDWTDLPLQPGFMPLLHDLVMALAGERGLERRSAVEIGDVAVLSRDNRADQLEINIEGPTATAPERRVLNATAQRGRGWQIAGLVEPGRYTATELRAGVPLTSRTVIVVPPGSESNLAALASGPLVRPPSAAGLLYRPKAPGHAAVLVVLLALLAFEGVVLARGTLRRREDAV